MDQLVPITLFVSSAILLLGIAYFRTRENMAMIEKGINPRGVARQPAPFTSQKYGLLFIGAGIGLMVAYFMDEFMFPHTDAVALYFAFIAIGGGLGLLASYRSQRAWMEAHPEKREEI